MVWEELLDNMGGLDMAWRKLSETIRCQCMVLGMLLETMGGQWVVWSKLFYGSEEGPDDNAGDQGLRLVWGERV